MMEFNLPTNSSTYFDITPPIIEKTGDIKICILISGHNYTRYKFIPFCIFSICVLNYRAGLSATISSQIINTNMATSSGIVTGAITRNKDVELNGIGRFYIYNGATGIAETQFKLIYL